MMGTTVRIAVAVALLSGVLSATDSVAGAKRGRGADAAASVKQISDTLGNIMKSLQDEGTEAQALFHKRRRWCGAGLRARVKEQKVGESSLQQLQKQLKDHEAVVKEAEMTVAMAQREVAKVQQSIEGTTQKAFKNASAAQIAESIEGKHQVLDSIQSSLQAALPNLAQLQEGALEVRQRLAVRTASVTSGRDFIAALKDDCAQGKQRAESLAAARTGELTSIQSALQVLEDLAPGMQKDNTVQTTPPSSDVVSSADDVSFVQWSKHRYNSKKSAVVSVDDSKLQRLLSQLKAEKNEETQQRSWCAAEQKRNEAALRRAKESLSQLQNEIKMHADTEAELTTDVMILEKETKALTATEKWATEGAQREDKLLASVSKDHRLAAKILDQAVAILVDIEHSGGLRGRMQRDASTAAEALKTARSSFDGQLIDSNAADAARRTAETAKAAAQARSEERKKLERVRDHHGSERLRGADDEEDRQAEVDEATSYLQKLQNECKSGIYAQRVRERTAQIQALKDAENVLQGKQLETPTNARPTSSAKKDQDLSPMERAAAEMHVAMDDN